MRAISAALLGGLILLTGCSIREQSDPEARRTTVNLTATICAEPDVFCDAVFFGDSITADSNFETFFPDRTIVNLGVYGDTLTDLLNRVESVRAEKPAIIFLLGGINSLRPDNAESCLEQYGELLDALKDACPEAKLVVQSVLPVAAALDPDGLENEAVRGFNAALETLAAEKGCAFADIYAVYEQNGALDPALTRDGLHLNFTAYGPWAKVIAPYLDKQT